MITKHISLLVAIVIGAALTLSAALPTMDMPISKLLGTTRQEEIMQNRIVPYAGAHVGGVHVDTSKSPPRIYMFDSMNNRILGFKGWQPVTLPNGPWPSADIVIGQPAMWDTGAANGNNIKYLPPGAATLALVPFPYISSTSESPRSGMMATDSAGNFYVVDLCNNRVLKYIDPFETDQIADQVWGHNTFTNRSPDNTTTPPPTGAGTLNTQWYGGGAYSAGVEVDAAGNIWVADSNNNRVLCFTNGAKTATVVLGQATFTSSSSGTALNQMNKPTGVRVHPATKEVFVLDGQENPRVMVFKPPFTNGKTADRIFGTNQLSWARGFCLDPFDTNIVWVASGNQQRIVQFNHFSGQALDCIGQVNLTTILDVGRYVRPDGSVANFNQPDGSISIDAQSNLYFTCFSSRSRVIRIPLPITRNGQGIVWSNGEMLKEGMNETSGRTVQDNYGMARWKNQLYVHDRYRMLVWTNYQTAVNFQSADFVIGQSALDKNEQYPAGGSTFEGRWIGMMDANEGSNVLFVTTDWKTYMFRLPITNGGVHYAAFKTIDGGTYKWADDNSPCGPLNIGSVCYDPASNVLWVAGGARVLRIRNIFDDVPLVDLVLGQTNKTGVLPNKGKFINFTGPFTVDATDFAAASSIYLDNYRNLYVVDGVYEGYGNLRVVRFNAAKTYPVGGTIFPNTPADAVFCKLTLTADRTTSGGADGPGTPITLAFNSANAMVLTEDTYSGAQGKHLYFYPTPQQTDVVNPQPTQIINTYLGQPASCFFDGPMFVLQDHTWSRLLFHMPRAIAPLVFVTNTIVTVTSASTALGGTNANLVGTMQWINERGGGGAFPATSPWQVTGIALQFGANLLTVSGTNTGGIVGSDAITITRAFLRGEGTPAISITNAPQSFPNGVTSCALGGVANQHAVGYISWSNNRGGSGSATATSSWVITGIPLSGGANLISVSATNIFGSNAVATITMTRAPSPGEGAPYVDVTTPDITVDESISAYTINGTNNPHVVGTLWWTNALGGGGTLAAITPWTILNVPLQLGDNVISVSGSNVYGDVASDSVRITREVVITGTTWQVLLVTNGMGYAGAGAGLRMTERGTLVKNYDRDGYVYLQACASAGNPRTQSIWRVRASTLSSMVTDWQLAIGGIPCNEGGGEPGQNWVKHSNVFYAALWCQFGIPNGGPWYWSWYGFYTTNAAGTPAALGADPATPLIARATGDNYDGAARNIGGIYLWTNVSALNAICTDRYKNSMDAQVRRWSGIGNLATLSERETEGVNTAYATCVLDPKQNGRALFLDATAADGQNWVWCATNIFADATNIQNAERRYQIPGSMTSDAVVDLAVLNHPNFYGNTLLAASAWTGSRKIYLYNLERPDLAPLDITPATGLSQWRNTLAAHEGYLFMNYDAGSEAPGIMRLSLIDFDLQPLGVPEPGVLLALLAPALLSLRACRFLV